MCNLLVCVNVVLDVICIMCHLFFYFFILTDVNDWLIYWVYIRKLQKDYCSMIINKNFKACMWDWY